MTLTLNPDRNLVRAAGGSVRHLLLRLVAPDAQRTGEVRPAHVALVLDRSGSMSGSKFRLAREAAMTALAQLRSGDRFSLVVYDHEAEVLVESSPATPAARFEAMRRLSLIEPRGGTNLSEGWRLGCEGVLASGGEGRCLLLTDGLANQGITDPAQLGQLAAELRRRGVATSCFGVGSDFDERFLQLVADGGAGHFYFVETPQQIADFLGSELQELLEVSVRGACIEVQLPPGVSAEPLDQIRALQVEDRLILDPGDLTALQELEVVLRLRFPAGLPGTESTVRVSARSRDGLLPPAEATVAFRYADHAANDRAIRDREVIRGAALRLAARARLEALACNRARDFARAEAIIEAAARRIRALDPTDPALEEQAFALLGERESLTSAMSSLAGKRFFQASSTLLHCREQTGRARKRTDPES